MKIRAIIMAIILSLLAFPAWSQTVTLPDSGTIINHLAKLTGTIPSATNLSTTDTIALGIASTPPAPFTGQVTITISGIAFCAFDGAVTVNDYFGASTTNAGQCADAGAFPTVTTLGQILGTGPANTYRVIISASVVSSLASRTAHGDSIYTILASDRYVVTNAALTAPRIWTLPAASTVSAGTLIVVADEFGGVTSTNTLTVARAGSDTIGGGTSVAIAIAYGVIGLKSDGVSKWTQVQDELTSANACPSHQFAISSNSTGPLLTCAQPAFSDISGVAAAAQIPTPTASTIGGVESKNCGGLFVNQISTAGAVTCTSGTLFVSSVPVIFPSSGSIGDNGALTGLTALPTTYAACYMYFPASAISAGSAAGIYYVVMSSTTAGTIYNNLYTTGTPTVIALPTAFATTGPGAYTQSITTPINLVTYVLPGGTLGKYDGVSVTFTMTDSSSGSNKLSQVLLGATVLRSFNSTTVISTHDGIEFYNRGSLSSQVASNPENSSGGAYYTGSTGNAIVYSAVNTAADANIIMLGQLALNTDFIVYESVKIRLVTAP